MLESEANSFTSSPTIPADTGTVATFLNEGFCIEIAQYVFNQPIHIGMTNQYPLGRCKLAVKVSAQWKNPLQSIKEEIEDEQTKL